MSGDPSNSPMSSTHRPGPAIRSVLNKKVVRSLQHRTHSCALRRSESMPPLRLHRRIPLLLRAKHLLLGAAHLRSQERRGIQPLTILSRRRAPRTGVGAAVFRNTFGATLSSRGRRVESRVQIVGVQPAVLAAVARWLLVTGRGSRAAATDTLRPPVQPPVPHVSVNARTIAQKCKVSLRGRLV